MVYIPTDKDWYGQVSIHHLNTLILVITVSIENKCVCASEKGPYMIFVKCMFLVLFDSLFHTANNDTIIQLIGATIYVLQVFV